MSLQEALKQMRMELGLTQADLAKKINKATISVNRWENGKGFPSRVNAGAILEIAKTGKASQDCLTYLSETLMPKAARSKSAASYGYPDIDRELLFQLADGSVNSLYVIEADTYNLLYANREAERAAARFLAGRGKKAVFRHFHELKDRHCYRYFGGLNEPCSFCPLSKLESDEYKDEIVVIPDINKKMRVHAKRTKMKGRYVYAMYVTDITDEEKERNALYEITNDIPQGIGIYNVYYDNRIELVFMNNILLKTIGESRRKAILQREASDICLIHSDDKTIMWDAVSKAVAQGNEVEFTVRMQENDGEYHKVCINGRLLKRDEEKMVFYCRFNHSL